MSWQELLLLYLNPAHGFGAVRDVLELGGVVLWILLALTCVLWSLLLGQYYYLRTGFMQWAAAGQRQWQARGEHDSWASRQIYTQLLSMARQRTQSFASFIRILIVLTPLLGLLGTVTGMMTVFDVIAISGTQNARALAGGIAQASLPTMTAMMIALTGLFFSNLLQRRAQRDWEAFRQRLEQAYA